MKTLSVINVTGPDALEFLQGQLSNDLRRLTAEPEILAAWCNPKGRVIWFGTVTRIEDGFALSAPAETAADIVKRLTLFRFRSKVDFQIIANAGTVDPGLLVQRGHPFIGSKQTEQFTPHMLNLDLLDAISFEKGCYTGQEIVARTHYKGATKRRTLRFESEQTVAEGSKVSDGDRDIGDVLNVAAGQLLAVVPVDKVGGRLTADGVEIAPAALPYAVGPGSEPAAT